MKELNNMNKIKYIAAVLIAVAGLGLQQAKAADFTSTLNVGNTDLSAFTAPYGTVDITLTSSTTATVTFTSNTAGGYYFIDGGAVDLNVNSTNFTVSNISDAAFSSLQTGSGLPPVDGFGDFNLQINNTGGTGSEVSTISFTLTNISGTWSSASDVLTLASGYDAAAHISTTVNGTNFTGYAAENAAGVPDGGTTVMLLGVALGALGMARRYIMS